MGASGSTTVDFGVFPGKSDTSRAVASTGILATSLVEAWLYPVLTTDHSADEHLVDGPVIIAGSISSGVGFTVYAVARDGISVPDAVLRSALGNQDTLQEHGRSAPRPYGLWTVGWCWN